MGERFSSEMASQAAEQSQIFNTPEVKKSAVERALSNAASGDEAMIRAAGDYSEVFRQAKNFNGEYKEVYAVLLGK
jgi:hypothetical protein